MVNRHPYMRVSHIYVGSSFISEIRQFIYLVFQIVNHTINILIIEIEMTQECVRQTEC